MKVFNSLRMQRPPVQNGENWIKFESRNEAKITDVMVYEPVGKSWDGSGLTAKNFKSVLDQVPKDHELNVRINSKGGDVWEGMAIKTMLDEWPNRVVANIDGIAASTASWIPMGADEVRAAKNSQIFIHDAIAFGFGNAEAMRKTADRLDTTSDQIAGMYAEKNGKSTKEMRKMMRDETLMTAEDALKLGLVDKVTDTKAVKNFTSEDLDEIRSRLRMLNRETPPTAGQTTPQIMNREQMLALLREHGVTVSNDATDEQLQAALKKLLETKNQKPADGDGKIVSLADFQKLEQANKDLEARLNKKDEAETAARKVRITNEVEKLIANDQVPASLKEKSIARAMTDEAYLDELRALPSKPPGAEPVKPTVQTNASVDDVLKAFDQFNDASRSWQRGNSVPMSVIGRNAISAGHFYTEHRNRILAFLNAAGDNTVAAGLKRQVLLQEAMGAFAPALTALRAFSTVHQNVPLQGTDIIDVPYYDLETAASTAWVAASGYVAGETTTDVRAVTINKRYYQSMGMTSSELARQPFLNVSRLVSLKALKLAIDVFQDILSVVTLANYGAATITKAANLFDLEDVIDLRAAANNAEWPEVGRSLILNSDYEAGLLKDASIKGALAENVTTPGQVQQLLGFDFYRTNKVPANAQNLVGFISHMSAIVVATSPIEPAPEVRQQLASYQVVTDPKTGASFEFKTFGSAQMDNAQSIVECNYGYVKGNASALKRITSA